MMGGRFGELLANATGPVVADGAMGTLLLAAGALAPGEPPDLATGTERGRAAVRAVHEAYRAAGAAIVLTDTFGANPWRLRAAGAEDRLRELNAVAARLAREAVGDDAVVAGSIGPTGEFLEPLGNVSYAGVVEGYARQVEALVEVGVDVAWIETMSDPEEAAGAVEAVRTTAPDLPIVVTVAVDRRGRTVMGADVAAVAARLAPLGIAAAGVNCSEPADVEAALATFRVAAPGLALVARANAGRPVILDGQVAYDVTPDAFGEHARRAARAGATIVGGCCGTTPDHVRALRGAVSPATGPDRPA